MTPQEEARESQRQNHIDLARLRMDDNGIEYVAVLGPEGSGDTALAHELGREKIIYLDSHAAVIAACAEPGIAGVVPVDAEDGEPIGDNRERLRKAGLSSIGSIRNVDTGDSTNIVIRYRSRHLEQLATEVRVENSDPAARATASRIMRQAIRAETLGALASVDVQTPPPESPSTYFVS